MSVNHWTREEHLVALHLYNELPYGSFDRKNSVVIKHSELIDRNPSVIAMKLGNFASLDPAITESGRKGLTGASKADKLIWKEMNSNWNSYASEIDVVMKKLKKHYQIEHDSPFETEELISPKNDYSGKERDVLVKACVGQSTFRKAVLSSYNFRCCISGLSVQKLLVASHIVPWKNDVENRLHPRNGLALSMIHDKAFDLGIMTVTEDFRVLVSKKYHSKDDEFF